MRGKICPLPSKELDRYIEKAGDKLKGTLLYMHVTGDNFQKWLGYKGVPYILDDNSIVNSEGVRVYISTLINNLTSPDRFAVKNLKNSVVGIKNLRPGTPLAFKTIFETTNKDLQRTALLGLFKKYGNTLGDKQKSLLMTAMNTILNSKLFDKIDFKAVNLPEGVFGEYNNYSQTLSLNIDLLQQQPARAIRTLAHELMHAATLEPFGKLANLGIDTKNISIKSLKEFFESEISNQFSENEKAFLLSAVQTYNDLESSRRRDYGLTSPEELVAEIFVSPTFFATVQKYLKDLVKAIGKLVGIDTNIFSTSLFEDTLNVITEISKKDELIGFSPFLEADQSFKEEDVEKDILDTVREVFKDVYLDKKDNIYREGSQTFERLSHLVQEKFSKKISSEEYSKKIAENIFRSQQKDINTEKVTVYDPSVKEELDLDYEQLIALNKKIAGEKTARGRIIHLMIEKIIKDHLGMDTSQIVRKIQEESQETDEHYEVQTKSYAWLLGEEGKETVKYWFETMGFNFFNKKTPKKERDDVMSEVEVKSKAFGIGTTIDLLVRHFDNSLSIVDFKSGDRLFVDQMTARIMNFSKTISDSYINKAKLEVVLRAFALKESIPEAKFRELNILSIDKFGEVRNLPIELKYYLDLIKNYLQETNPEIIEEYEKKGMFKEARYYTTKSTSVRTAEEAYQVEDKKEHIENYILDMALTKDVTAITGDERARVFNDVKAFLELKTHTSKINLEGRGKDVSDAQLFIGNQYSASNPLVQKFIVYLNKVRDSARDRKKAIMKEHDAKYQAVKKDYLAKHPNEKGLFDSKLGGVK